jgi:hypothetical protein
VEKLNVLLVGLLLLVLPAVLYFRTSTEAALKMSERAAVEVKNVLKNINLFVRFEE